MNELKANKKQSRRSFNLNDILYFGLPKSDKKKDKHLSLECVADENNQSLEFDSINLQTATDTELESPNEGSYEGYVIKDTPNSKKNRKKKKLEWTQIEAEIIERSETEDSSTIESKRWESNHEKMLHRSNTARSLMNSVSSKGKSPRKKIKSINSMLENQFHALSNESSSVYESMSGILEKPKHLLKKSSHLNSSQGISLPEKQEIKLRKRANTNHDEKIKNEIPEEQEEQQQTTPIHEQQTEVIVREKSRHHIRKILRRKKHRSSVELELLEIGKLKLEEIKKEQNRRDFVLKIQENSNLLHSFPEFKKGNIDDMFYSLFEEEDNETNIEYHVINFDPIETINIKKFKEQKKREEKDTKKISSHDDIDISDEIEKKSIVSHLKTSSNFAKRKNSLSHELKYCSVSKLISILFSYHKTPNYYLISCFILSYRCFLQSDELMELLIYRAFGHPADQSLWDNWIQKHQFVQNNILQFLCNWIDFCYSYDFEDNDRMMYMLAQFYHFLEVTPSLNNILLRIIGSRVSFYFLF